MSIEAVSPLYEDKNWDIAVACDINLSRCFGSKDGLSKDSFLDISSFAIASTLNNLGSETTSGSVLFTAVNNSALNGVTTKQRFSDLNTFGSCVNHDDGHTEVNVVVAHTEYPAFKGKLTIYERTDKAKQSTAVHELSHVLDINDKQMQSSIINHDNKHKYKRIAPTIIAFLGMGGATYEYAGITTDNSYIKAGCVALTAAIGSLITIREVYPSLDYKHYLSKPNEVKAREAEKDADKHPQIISFVAI